MALKHASQKQRKGRQFWKDSAMIQFFLLSFVSYILYNNSQVTLYDDIYSKHSLPPLSSEGPWGIFNSNSKGNNADTIISKNLYYCPNNHNGVEHLIKSLVTKYPQINAIGAVDSTAVNQLYEQNLFDTWASLQFILNGDQISNGSLIVNQTSLTTVSYTILISPNNWGSDLSTDNFTSNIYNDQGVSSDLFWSSGYMTLENFVDTYLAQQFDFVSDSYSVETFLQRYPSSSIYKSKQTFDMSTVRYSIWKWIGGTVLSMCVFVPMLALLTETVRERQYRMKDLLEISGLMNCSYWFSYYFVISVVCQVSIWLCIGLLELYTVLDENRAGPYAALLTVYALGAAAFGTSFGFVVFRSEYYGLPSFMINSALTVCGAYLGIAYDISTGLKLFFCFLSPSVGLTMGVLIIETYLYHYTGSTMDYNYVDTARNYPSLNAVLGVTLLSTLMYSIITIGMPFDWVVKAYNSGSNNAVNIAEMMAAARADDIDYPCDLEEEAAPAEEEKDEMHLKQEDRNSSSSISKPISSSSRSAYRASSGPANITTTVDDEGVQHHNQQHRLLQVSSLSHVYPDGTNAVRDMSFNVKEGEVLSFLGANGAGKSTCMGMLCGTLNATFGDAIVNGYSISQQRTLARRNLGIAMQQDIIWDDVNVEDHLMLFGRLRGLHGAKLRADVDAMANSLGFPEKRKALAGTLSGGQKRRLCVGLSMVGGNSVVYLDEPTAGLDPVSRRQLWELVQKNRKGRAILLTTHFMDEADVLGDRIAIVKEGRLRALGTSKFLKQRFGIGYLLRMSLTEHASKAATDMVQARVRNFVPDCALASSAGTELSLRLPSDAVPLFPSLFETLEAESRILGIVSYGIETTTLEEVFMRIVNEDNELLLANHTEANRLLGASPEERDLHRATVVAKDEKRHPFIDDAEMTALLVKGNGITDENGLLALYPQTMVMLHKRYYQFVRSRGQLTMGIALPIILAIIIGVLLSTMPSQLLRSDSPAAYAIYQGSTSNGFPTTYTAGSSESTVEIDIAASFGTGISTTYVGTNYSALYDAIEAVASGTRSDAGNSSSTGIAYEGGGVALNNFTVMYNASYPMNFAAAVQNMLEEATSNATNGLLAIDQSYNMLPVNQLDRQLNSGAFIAMLLALFGGAVGAGMSIVLSGERVTLVKHQQLASGASSIAYWTGNFIFDFLLMFSLVLIFGVIFVLFKPDSYDATGYGYVVGSGFFFAVASIFRFYSFSYLIEDVRLAQSIYFYGSLGSIFVLVDVWFTVLFTTASANANDSSVVATGMAFSLIDPTFGWFLIVLYKNNFVGMLTQNSGKDFLSEIVGGYFNMLVVAAFLYGAVFILLTEGGLRATIRLLYHHLFCFSRSRVSPTMPATSSTSLLNEAEVDRGDHAITVAPDHPNNKNTSAATATVSSLRPLRPAMRIGGQLDPDVLAEKEKVQNIYEQGMQASASGSHNSSNIIDARSNAIFIKSLRKVYYARGSVPAKVAVKEINITIPQGEVFGLLGANGAGKTTLLKIVSGQEQPTSGVALINGYDVVHHTSQAQRSMGLCPQFDTLIERLSVRENLLFFGQIKGLSGKDLLTVAEAFMKAMSIKRYENKLIQQLSGGNRRKVSLAVALMGAPPTVYLDEPSTGLDPVASRLMWRLLSKISAAKNTAIVLTTHNMLECEAVCTRICIMKLGEIVCLGDNQHLRSAHGTGFLLEANMRTPEHADEVKKFVSETFAFAVVVDEQATMANFEIPRSSINKLSQAFRIMEQNKDRLGIVDYALSQSTLEQVFLKQIRPSNADRRNQLDQQSMDNKRPLARDYTTGYAMWLLAALVPGLHHFYLGNYWRGVKYLLTFNEVYAGWILDLFEMHALIQASVQEHGSIPATCFCTCCFSLCCCCCASPTVVTTSSHGGRPKSSNIDADDVSAEVPEDLP